MTPSDPNGFSEPPATHSSPRVEFPPGTLRVYLNKYSSTKLPAVPLYLLSVKRHQTTVALQYDLSSTQKKNITWVSSVWDDNAINQRSRPFLFFLVEMVST